MKKEKPEKLRIRKYYRIALACFAFPFLFLAALFIDSFYFSNKTEMLFWALFLFTLFPFALLGNCLVVYGFLQAKKYNNYKKQVTGVTNLLAGIPILFIGFIGFCLLLVVSW
jgi:fatty acid desaturase